VFAGQGVAFGGDVLFQGSIGADRTLPTAGDFDTLVKKHRARVAYAARSTHRYSGPWTRKTTVGRERRANPFLTGAYRLG